MSYRYIILLDASGLTRKTVAALAEIGFRRRFASRRVNLFAPEQTPTFLVPGEGVIVGDLFRRDGTRIDDAAGVPADLSHAGFRRFLMENCWGDYLLVQADANAPGSIFLRDPSPGGDLCCFHSLQQGVGFVASDISLPIRLGLYRRRIDWDFIAHCAAYPHLKLDRTALVGILELLPGCALHVEGDKSTTVEEWSPWKFTSSSERYTDPFEASKEVRNAVRSVVASWATADDAILLELSGGLDSSIVGACLRHTPARVACCTLTTTVPGADERTYAGLIAEMLDTQLTTAELNLDDAQFAFTSPDLTTTPRVGLLHYVVDQAMEAAATRLGTSSFFSGSGGDSVFCYLTTAAPAADAFRDRGPIAGANAVHDLAELHQCTVWTAGRLTLRKLVRAPKAPCGRDISFLRPNNVPADRGDHPWFSAPSDALAGDRERICDLAGNQIFRDGSPRGVRRRLRMPLLSQPVVEACLRAPSWMWISEGRNRAIARQAFAEDLPREVLNRRSKGNFVSYLGAVYRRSKPQMLEFLLMGELEAHGMLDPDALRRFSNSALPPRDRSFMRIFDLCTIENWCRQS